MSNLATWYASGGKKALAIVVEIHRQSAESIFLYCGYEPIEVTLENGSVITAEPSSLETALLPKNNMGNQSLALGFSNVTGEVLEYIDAAFEDDESVFITYREYLSDDLTTLARPSIILTVHAVDAEGSTVRAQAGYFDVVNTAFNRAIYSATDFPGLRYS